LGVACLAVFNTALFIIINFFAPFFAPRQDCCAELGERLS